MLLPDLTVNAARLDEREVEAPGEADEHCSGKLIRVSREPQKMLPLHPQLPRHDRIGRHRPVEASPELGELNAFSFQSVRCGGIR